MGIFRSADGASNSVRLRQRATPSTFLGSVACADHRIVLASRERQQAERDQRVDGVAEQGGDSPTHRRCRKIGCAGGDGGMGRRGGIASMVLFGRRCGWAAGHSEKKGRSNKEAIFCFFYGDCFSVVTAL